MLSSEIEQLRNSFDEMTMAEKKKLIDNLRDQLKIRKNAEYTKFLNDCIKTYNTIVIKERRKERKRVILLWVTWVLFLITLCFVIYIMTKYISKANQIKAAIETGSSTQLSAGMVVSKNDVVLEAKDITIRHHSKASTTTLEIWDFAYEDGDMIQVFVNNQPVTEKIELLNEPIQVEVPTVGIAEVRGIFDGGGGITYAVYCELDETTYLNNAPIEGSNKYIFQRQ